MHIYSRKHIAHLLLFKPQHTLPLIAHLALLHICPREDIWSAVAPNILLTSIQMMRTSGRAECDRVVGIQGPKCGTFDLTSFISFHLYELIQKRTCCINITHKYKRSEWNSYGHDA